MQNLTDRRLAPQIHRKLLKLRNGMRTNNPIEKPARNPNGCLTREDPQMANMHMKSYSPSCVTGGLQIKTTGKGQEALVGMARGQNTSSFKHWQGSETVGTHKGRT